MTKDAYPALFHFLHRRMQDISYPVTREDLLRIAGDRPVPTDWNVTIPLGALIIDIEKESFSCAADFYCALIASMSETGKERLTHADSKCTD